MKPFKEINTYKLLLIPVYILLIQLSLILVDYNTNHFAK